MPWEQTLEVTAGHVRFEPERTSATFRVSGTLQCTAPFLVRFQVAEYSAGFAISARGQDLSVIEGTVALRARKKSRRGYESPSSFLVLCQRLLAPSEREPFCGYVFSVNLDVGAKERLACSLNDQEHTGNERTLVEFAYLEEPYVLIRDGEARLLATPEWLEGALRDKLRHEHGWPFLEHI
jgi:hypothetical protein